MQLFDFQTNLVDNEDNVPMWFGSTLEALQKIEVTIPAKSNCSPVCLCFVLCSNFFACQNVCKLFRNNFYNFADSLCLMMLLQLIFGISEIANCLTVSMMCFIRFYQFFLCVAVILNYFNKDPAGSQKNILNGKVILLMQCE